MLLALSQAACEEDIPPSTFESALGLEVPCYPIERFLIAAKEHIANELTGFSEANDSRASQFKYADIHQLLETAHNDLGRCLEYYSRQSSAVVHDETYFQFADNLNRMWFVLTVYEGFLKPWEDSDIDLLTRGLNGELIEPDLTWDCPEECETET